MKMVTTYIAYDGTEFDDMGDCRVYEAYAWDMLISIIDNIIIYTDLGKEITPPYFNNLEEALDWFGKTFNSINFIRVKAEIPSSAYAWQDNYFGFIFPQEPGLYRYNFFTNEWTKLAE